MQDEERQQIMAEKLARWKGWKISRELFATSIANIPTYQGARRSLTGSVPSVNCKSFCRRWYWCDDWNDPEFMKKERSMERLTIEYCGEYVPRELCSIDRYGGADDCDLCCEYCKAAEEGNEDCSECAINQCFNKLGEYEDLEEQGKLLKLPCANWAEIVFGDQEVFWGIDMDYIENPIREISVDSSERITWYGGWETVVLRGVDENGLDWEFLPEEIGRTVFLTREEAKTALEEIEVEGND